jgi:hypothetical protein
MFHLTYGESEVRCDTADEVRSLLNGKGRKAATSNDDGAHEAQPQRRKRRKRRGGGAEAPANPDATGEGTTTGTGDASPEVPYTTKALSWANVKKIGKKIGWTGTQKELMRKLQERKAAGR